MQFEVIKLQHYDSDVDRSCPPHQYADGPSHTDADTSPHGVCIFSPVQVDVGQPQAEPGVGPGATQLPVSGSGTGLSSTSASAYRAAALWTSRIGSLDQSRTLSKHVESARIHDIYQAEP